MAESETDRRGLRIVYAGTPDFAVPALNTLADSRHAVVAVYTQPDRPAGRGRKPRPSPVKQAALERGLPVCQPARFDAEAREALAAWEPDLMVVTAYGLILPRPVLDTPRLGCINIHASLLPRWRGAAPIQRAIEAGDRETGISIMQMDEGLDTGPVLLTRRLPLDGSETGGSLHDSLARLGADAVLEAVDGLARGDLAATPQSRDDACYARKLRKDEAEIDWIRPANAIAAKVRAFSPWPVAQTRWKDRVLRIHAARPVAGEAAGRPGEVVAADRDGAVVATGEGCLALETVQLPGRKRITGADLVNAGLTVGDRLEKTDGD